MSWAAQTKLDEVGRALGSVLRDHALLVFLLVTTLGASYEFFFYMEFRVNVLQFAEPLDFLFAAIRQPVVVLFGILPLVLLRVLRAFEFWLRRRIRAYDRAMVKQEAHPRYAALQRTVSVMFVIVYFALFTIRYADFVSDRLKRGHGRPVQVELANADRPGRLLRGTLLGTTSKYVFVYTVADSLSHVIPVESISEMMMLSRRQTARRDTSAAAQ